MTIIIAIAETVKMMRLHINAAMVTNSYA